MREVNDSVDTEPSQDNSVPVDVNHLKRRQDV